MEFDTCINLVKEACKAQAIEPSADMMLDCATRVFNATRIETAKAEVNGNVPATEKQLQAMKNMKIDFKPGITKKEAGVLIDEAINKWKK